MKKGLAIGCLIGILGVSVIRADDDVHGPMTALRKIIALMERLVTLSQEVADNTKATKECACANRNP